MRNKAVWGWRIGVGVAVMCAIALSGCSRMIRTGQASSYLILTSLEGAPGGGARSGSFTTSLPSDVITLVPALTGIPTVFGDIGQATFQLQMKDTLDTPTEVNAITLTQYHVKFVRADGHNVQGVDVPYEFDGGLNITVSGTATVGFDLVRNQAKDEAPLLALRTDPGTVISTIAQVTFYGHDQTGRNVSVSGQLNVNFSNYGD